ncbi:MAG: hypothetical protein KBG48_21945 [Kofleriaceae bacterium]|jgi:hypothetical protein|nr:hypothetical protein [Kofleriaceae bacterium]MBP9170084.1 hypothetical protein [Kofleriaceae bacterium]MBP9858215.1 hypothetical protein [Kofleriaceae bacterium]
MSRLVRFAVAAALTPLALTAAACGDDPSPLLGVWQVTAHTANPAGCDAEGPAVAEPPFIKFIEGEFFGQEFVERVDCTSATMCDEGGNLFGELYTEDIPNGLRSSIYASSGDSTACVLSGSRADATIVNGVLRIEKRSYASGTLAGVTCEPETAEAMLATLPCVELEVTTGTKVD